MAELGSHDGVRRADARQNHERLVAAAVAAFATGDADQSTLKAIAARAGVGIGTLYRHFPTREALVEAAYRDELDRLQDAADALLSEHEPLDALRLWLDRFAAYVAAKRGMAETLRAIVDAGVIASADTRSGLAGAIGRLLHAGATAHTIRDDVDPYDVFTLLAGIFLATENDPEPERVGRLLDLLIAAVRAEGAATRARRRPAAKRRRDTAR